MPDKKKKTIDDKIAKIGEFTTPKEGVGHKEPVGEEIPLGETPHEEQAKEDGKEKLEGLSPEEIKEKIISLVAEVSSRGIPEEERVKFLENFKFWNGALFQLLDIGDSLKTLVGKTSITLTPVQALLIYAGTTVLLIILLRPDLQAKIFKTKTSKKEKETPVEAKIDEEEQPLQKIKKKV